MSRNLFSCRMPTLTYPQVPPPPPQPPHTLSSSTLTSTTICLSTSLSIFSCYEARLLSCFLPYYPDFISLLHSFPFGLFCFRNLTRQTCFRSHFTLGDLSVFRFIFSFSPFVLFLYLHDRDNSVAWHGCQSVRLFVSHVLSVLTHVFLGPFLGGNIVKIICVITNKHTNKHRTIL